MSTTTTAQAPACRTADARLERILFALAGSVALLSAGLAAAVSPWWLLLTAFAGLNQLAYAAFGDCVASLVLRRLLSDDTRGTR